MRRGCRFANREMTAQPPLQHEPRRQMSDSSISPSTATLTESDMEEYDTATIRLEKDSLLPSVFAEINGAVLPFVIDTGARFSGICLTHVTALGFAKEDLIPRIPGEPSYIVGYLKLSYTMGTFENSIEFDVFDMGKDVNLLGLDILKVFCCVIDLDKGVLTFRDFVRFENNELRTPELIVNIQGKDVEVEIDTGSEFFMNGTLAQAKELNLSLTKIDNYKAGLVDCTAFIEYIARDFCIKACGRESWDGEYAVLPDETAKGRTEPLMGVLFFIGARLEFTQDGGFEVTFPAEESEKPPVATSTEETQESVEEPAATSTEET